MANEVSFNILVMPLGTHKLVASYNQITRIVTQHNEIARVQAISEHGQNNEEA